MIKKQLISGCLLALALIPSGLNAIMANANEPLCYMRTSNGQTINLTKLCVSQPRPQMSSHSDEASSAIDDSQISESSKENQLLQEAIEINSQNQESVSPSSSSSNQ